MSERCIVRVKFTPAGGEGAVRRAVGGFLRYIQHRDLHPTSHPMPAVSGLVKYIAYRDQAAARAELFASDGSLGTKSRKDFVDFVAHSLAESKPQLFRGRDGQLVDRRRAVSRLMVSPERAAGLDLERLTRAAMDRLSADVGGDVRWIAAIHRNTAHHHVHLVVAGMRQDAAGNFHRVDITKPRLVAMKQAVALEIERQREERQPSRAIAERTLVATGGTASTPALKPPVPRPALIRILPVAVPGSRLRAAWQKPHTATSMLRLRAVARMYQRQAERDAEEEARRRQWELVA